MDKNVPCPYCGIELLDVPKRKKKCPHCGKYIYVRSKRELFDSILLSEQELMATNEFTKLSSQYGLTKSDYINKERELTERFDKKAQPTDVIWGLYTDLITKYINDDQTLQSIYFNQASFLDKEGKDSFKIRQIALKKKLLNYKSLGVEMVGILCAGNSCESCKKYDEKILSIEEALRVMPLPVKDCSHIHNCRCTYVSASAFGHSDHKKAYKIKRLIKKKKFTIGRR